LTSHWTNGGNNFIAEKFNSTVFVALGRQNHQRLVVAAFIGEGKKGEQLSSLICAETITDFEGQLIMDPEQLEVGDGEYEGILQ
jgi:hypothetical protein